MKKEGLAAVIVILIAASLGVVYLASNSVTRTGTSASSSAFTYRTVISSTSLSTTVENNIATTFNIVLTSTLTATWGPGQPIPAAMVETDNFSAAGGAFVLDSNTHRIYILGTSSLTVVDASSHSVVAKVPFPANNTGGLINAGLTIDTSTNMVYASVQGEVVEVDGSTNTLVGEIPLGLRTLAYNPATYVLWGTMIGVTQVQGPLGATGNLIGVDVRTNSVVENVSIGFAPFGIAVDPHTNMVYADGCAGSFVCGSKVAVVNGARGTLVATVNLGSEYYPTMTLNPSTHVVYVSGDRELAALNGTTGSVIFKVDPQTCGPFTDMVVDPQSNLVLTSAVNYNYLLAYDGGTGKLVNMYSFGSSLGPVAFDPSNGQVYVATATGQLLAIRMYATTGNVDSTLIGAGRDCLPPRHELVQASQRAFEYTKRIPAEAQRTLMHGEYPFTRLSVSWNIRTNQFRETPSSSFAWRRPRPPWQRFSPSPS